MDLGDFSGVYCKSAGIHALPLAYTMGTCVPAMSTMRIPWIRNISA
jgi:hypothetical protein